MTFAVVPAGGQSTRMGRPKLALPLGGRTVIEYIVTALRRAEVEPVLVVVGPHVTELVPLAERAGAQVCLLPWETADMRATVEAGLHWLEERCHPAAEDDWLLVPGDHPLHDGAIVRELRNARTHYPSFSIFVPIWQGRRGHPTLLTWGHVEGIRAHPAGLGLNSYLRGEAAQVYEVPAKSADVLLDLDTPEDYSALQQQWTAGPGSHGT